MNRAQIGFSLYSKVPQGILRRIAQENFRKTVRFVYPHSKFYRREFDNRGIRPERVRHPQDLGDFFTTPEDIRTNVEDFICLRPDTAFETTGTTSKKPKRVYFSRTEIREAGFAGAVGLWGLGVRPEDRIASAFDDSFWVSGPVLQASCEVLGCFHVEAGRIDPKEFYERLLDYGITVIVGDPSWILRLSEVAAQKGPWPVKLLIGGGENLRESARRYVEGIWKADFILSYGQTEAFGAIGMESRTKNGYHLNELHNFFEIVDADADRYGELVYTTLNRRVMPLVRYRSGDVTRFLEGADAGGIPGRRIEKLKGRTDEWIATAIGNIAPWMFEPLLHKIQGLGEDWQLEIETQGIKDLLRFHVEVRNGGPSQESDLKEKIFGLLRKELASAWALYEMGLVHLDLQAHPIGTLRKSGRKLRRLVDKRRFS